MSEYGFANWNSNNNGGEDSGFSGFNPEDYMSNLGNIVSEGEGGGLMPMFAKALFDDQYRMDKNWQAGMGKYNEWYEGTQNFGNVIDERHTETLGEVDDIYGELNEKQRGYNQQRTASANEMMGKVNSLASRNRATFNAGSAEAKGFMAKATAKAKETEAEYKDYTKEAMSAQVAGITGRYKAQKGSKLEAARRSGASGTVLSQIEFDMDQEMGTQMQGQTATAAMAYQDNLTALSMGVAKSIGDQGSMAGQMAVAGSSLDAQNMQMQARGFEVGHQTEMQNVASLENLSTNYANTKVTMALSHEVQMARAAEIAMGGNQTLGTLILNNPPTASADVLATLLTYATAPQQGALRNAMLPGMRQEQLGQKRDSLSEQYPGIDFSNYGIHELNNFDPNHRDYSGISSPDPGYGF
jgi:hypothetical protein